MERSTPASLGDALVQMGVVSQDQLRQALTECAADQKNLAQVLVAKGFASDEKILKAVSLRWGIPYMLSLEGALQEGASGWLPEPLARKYLVVPILKSEDALTLGMVDPLDIRAIDDIAASVGLHIRPVMVPLSNLFDAVRKVYGDGNGRSAAPAPAAGGKADSDERAVETINSLLQEGIARKASDIHLEPADKETRVRFRVDGMLQPGRSFPKAAEASLVARIKILAKLDITETRLPQDGHLSFEYGGFRVDLRVSTLPTVHGEKVMLRILDSTRSLRTFADLGMAEGVQRSLSEAIRKPNGMVLVTGPTGSGKTTTLYAAIALRNEVTHNIVTLEDPVEYRIDRINQVEINPRIGLSFAAGLRSVLRQDPNIVLVGEIRDAETAEIAVQAAITGHLVLSTLHTNDTVTAVHRLVNMRIEPFLIASAVNGVLAQRLLRRLCERCKRPHAPEPREAEALGAGRAAAGTFAEAPGCEACFGTGYKGRVAIYEWLSITRAIRDLILAKASIDDLRVAARKGGLVSLQEDGLAKAAQGTTSLAEVIRVTHRGGED